MDSYEREGRLLLQIEHLEDGSARVGIFEGSLMHFHRVDRQTKLVLSSMLVNGEESKPAPQEEKPTSQRYGQGRTKQRRTRFNNRKYKEEGKQRKAV